MCYYHTPKTIKIYLNPAYSTLNGHYDLKRPGKLTPYEQYIINIRSSGQIYKEIYKFIISKGYNGSVAAIQMFMQKEHAHAKSSRIQEGKEYIYRKIISQLVYRKLEDIKLITKNQYDTLLKQYLELVSLYSILRDFQRIIFSKKGDYLE